MQPDVVPDKRKYVSLDDAAKKLGYKSSDLEKKAFTKLVDVRSVGNIKYLDSSVFDKISPVETHSAEWGSVSFLRNLAASQLNAKNAALVKGVSLRKSAQKKEEGIKVISKRVEIRKESIHSADGVSLETELEPEKKSSKKETPIKTIDLLVPLVKTGKKDEVDEKLPEVHDEFLPKLAKKTPQKTHRSAGEILKRALKIKKRQIPNLGIIDVPQTVYSRVKIIATQKMSIDFVPILALALFAGIMFGFTQSITYIILNEHDLKVSAIEAVKKPQWALDALAISAIENYDSYATLVQRSPKIFEQNVGEMVYLLSSAIYNRDVVIYETPPLPPRARHSVYIR